MPMKRRDSRTGPSERIQSLGPSVQRTTRRERATAQAPAHTHGSLSHTFSQSTCRYSSSFIFPNYQFCFSPLFLWLCSTFPHSAGHAFRLIPKLSHRLFFFKMQLMNHVITSLFCMTVLPFGYRAQNDLFSLLVCVSHP